jgi:hypothetical protein
METLVKQKINNVFIIYDISFNQSLNNKNSIFYWNITML